MPRNSTSVFTKQQRIAELAKRSPQMAFTSLAYLMDIDWLKEAYRRTRKDGAAGVDGQTADEYEQDLEGNLQSLSGPGEVRHVPGTAGAAGVHSQGGSSHRDRPIGIPTLEDKVLQRAVVMLLEPIYEQDFDGLLVWLPARAIGTPGPGRPLEADDGQRGGWILEVDIRKFFDTFGSCPPARVSSTQGT